MLGVIARIKPSKLGKSVAQCTGKQSGNEHQDERSLQLAPYGKPGVSSGSDGSRDRCRIVSSSSPSASHQICTQSRQPRPTAFGKKFVIEVNGNQDFLYWQPVSNIGEEHGIDFESTLRSGEPRPATATAKGLGGCIYYHLRHAHWERG
jgi:hypothetical protein